MLEQGGKTKTPFGKVVAGSTMDVAGRVLFKNEWEHPRLYSRRIAANRLIAKKNLAQPRRDGRGWDSLKILTRIHHLFRDHNVTILLRTMP